MSDTRPRPVVPEELPKILHDLGYAVIKNNPVDIISFAADYFQKLRDEKEKETTDELDGDKEAAAETVETEESPDIDEDSARNI